MTIIGKRKETGDEGIAIGVARGKAEDILHLLENTGKCSPLPKDFVEKIQAQRDETVLKRWLLSAARAQSVEQFREWEGL